MSLLKLNFSILISLVTILFLPQISLSQSKVSLENNLKYELKEIFLEGNTLFDSELEEIAALYKNKPISIKQLLNLKRELTNFYVSQGYRNSGAFLPPQKLENGSIKIIIVEGILSEIKIDGLENLDEKYIETRLPLVNKPLNINEIDRALSLLKKDVLIANISAEVISQEIGKNILLIEVQEKSPFQASLIVTNSYSPSIGSFGGRASVTHNNLLGFGDRATISRTQTEGLRRTGGFYSIPLDSRESRITFKYDAAHSEVQTEEIKELGIEADSEVYSVSLERSIIFKADEKFFLGLQLQRIDSESFVLKDDSFSFTEGLTDGRINITALRFSQNYLKNWNDALLAVNSQFSVGIDLFDATVSDLGIDGIFSSWKGDIQYLVGLDRNNKIILISRLTVQLSTYTLVPAEQITIGGVDTVPGYKRNIGNADNGLIGGLSLQIPVAEKKWGTIKIIPFVSAGGVWNNDRENKSADFLASFGVGLSYQLSSTLEIRLNYAIPLVEPDGFENTDTTDNFTFLLNFYPQGFLN